MAISHYLKELRQQVGTRLLLVPSVAAIIRNEEGAILLQKTADDHRWSLPGGAIDPGERPEESVVREVHEETGLIVVPEEIITVLGGTDYRYIYPNGDRVEYVITLFSCRIIGGEPGGLDDETIDLAFVPVDDMPELTLPYPPSLFA